MANYPSTTTTPNTSDITLAESGGRVGIGTTTYVTNVDLLIKRSNNGLVGLYLENSDGSGTSAFSVMRIGELTSSVQKSVNLEYHNAGLTDNGLIKKNQGVLTTGSSATNGLLIATQANAPIVFGTNGWPPTEKMRIDGGGLVGMGGRAPEKWTHC